MALTSLFIAPAPTVPLAVDPGGSFALVYQGDPDGTLLTFDAPPTVVYTAVAAAAIGPLACADVTPGGPAGATLRTVSVPVPATRADGSPLAGSALLATVSALIGGVYYPLQQYVIVGAAGSAQDNALDRLDDLEDFFPAGAPPFTPGVIPGFGPGNAYARQKRWDRAKFGGDLILAPAGYAPLSVRRQGHRPEARRGGPDPGGGRPERRLQRRARPGSVAERTARAARARLPGHLGGDRLHRPVLRRAGAAGGCATYAASHALPDSSQRRRECRGRDRAEPRPAQELSAPSGPVLRAHEI